MSTLQLAPYLAVKMVERIDHIKTGQNARLDRRNEGFSLRAVARQMKLSAPFVSDLELGRRNWDAKRALDYMRALTFLKVKRIQSAMKNAHNTNLKLD